jgi:hypothetical protein
VKTHYQLLGLDPAAPADEIKRAFRREIARYHPDKVQHLGPEFQEIAASRAAELTEAYRMLMDTTSRRSYDEALGNGVGYDPHPAPRQGTASGTAAPVEAPVRSESAEPAAPPERVDRRFQQERATTGDVLRKAAIAKLRDAVGRVNGSEPFTVAGFDAAYVIKPRRSLYKKPEPHMRLLARFVSHVDSAAVEEAWPLATKSGAFDGVICMMLLGSALSPVKELGIAVAEQRRKTRTGAPVVVPVDVRDWEALFPPDVPDVVRQIVQRLRDGS